MYHWYCRSYDENDDWTAYCVYASSEGQARKIVKSYLKEYEDVHNPHVELELWNQFEHGDVRDYEILD